MLHRLQHALPDTFGIFVPNHQAGMESIIISIALTAAGAFQFHFVVFLIISSCHFIWLLFSN
jgi:hypothetical protein